jgi:hypothetical protein
MDFRPFRSTVPARRPEIGQRRLMRQTLAARQQSTTLAATLAPRPRSDVDRGPAGGVHMAVLHLFSARPLSLSPVLAPREYLWVRYANGRYLALDFSSTDPLETMTDKRPAFLVSREQRKDQSNWSQGHFS